jgi:hypothetical protein
MIAETEQFSFTHDTLESALDPDLAAQIRRQDTALAWELWERFCRPLPTGAPWDWVIPHVVFDEPQVKGPFNPSGRWYLEEPINNENDPDVTTETYCWATGSAKTVMLMARAAWAMEFDPFRGLWVMPARMGEGGAFEFNSTRFTAMIRKMPCFVDKIPLDRHKLKGLQVNMAGNVIGFVGSNSPAQVGANRCRRVVQDEKDKFKKELSREAGAGYLANERTKGVPNPKRIGTSTPTTEEGPIWQDLMASDLRRRFLTCPLCGQDHPSTRRMVLVKDEQFTVLPTKFPGGTTIPLAPLRWDKEAKRQDGTWDMDRVISSARFECPHCGGHVRDHHRLWLDKNGVWMPTRPSGDGAGRHRGYHLPSFYAPHLDFDSSWGGMAKKFLDAHSSSDGMRGYINSDLAEVHVSQESGRGAIELSSRPLAQSDWTPLLTVDIQAQWPYLWFVVRKWSSFKLQPPLEFTGGRPAALSTFTEEFKKKLSSIVAGHEPAWLPASELLRFDTGTSETPLIDWLIEKKIHGENLSQIFQDRCMSNTVDFGKWIYREMGLKIPRGGDSESIAAGHCQTDDWAELREIFQQFEVGKHLINRNAAVLIDSGYREKNNPETLRKCYETATEFGYYDPSTKKMWSHAPNRMAKPCPLNNWQPWKGYPITRRWNVEGIAREWHYNFADPFAGTSEADQCVIQVLEGAADLFWERMNALREKRTQNIWAVAGDLRLFPKDKFQLSQYERQLNARFWDSEKQCVKNRGTGGAGHKSWPDELSDCEKMQVALADSLGFFSYENDEKNK